jgi:His-Xaa-Ser system protein HxsD
MEIMQKFDDGRILLRVNKTIYCQEAILAAAYKFSDNYYVHVDSLDSDYYGVYFAAKQHPDTDLISHIKNFGNELIDQQLRYNLDQSNKSIKELIIKKAFFPFESDENQ